MPYFQALGKTAIYYDQYGRDEGSSPTIILLHGLGSSGQIWRPQIPYLKKSFRVILLDFPGHGKSERLKHYSIEQFSDVLTALLDHLHLETAHFAALSFGAAVGLTFACRHPERVASLTLQGPVGGIISPHHPKAWPEIFLSRVFPFLLHLAIFLFGFTQTACFINRYGVNTPKRARFIEMFQRQADLKAIFQLLNQLVYPPYVGQLDKITAPIMILRGIRDIVPKEQIAYIVDHLTHCSRPAQQIDIPDASHVVSLDHPKLFKKYFLLFLQSLQSNSPARQGPFFVGSCFDRALAPAPSPNKAPQPTSGNSGNLGKVS